MINHNPAKEKGLGCSLFQRYAEKDKDLLMLTTQYRMVCLVELPLQKLYIVPFNVGMMALLLLNLGS